MNRINKLFNEKKQNILSLYFCAGHPTAGSTADIIRTLAARGIDMLEIGIPFSDPMADGPVIQDAATKALRNGMSLHRLFEELKDIRQDVEIPLILMGYYWLQNSPAPSQAPRPHPGRDHVQPPTHPPGFGEPIETANLHMKQLRPLLSCP